MSAPPALRISRSLTGKLKGSSAFCSRLDRLCHFFPLISVHQKGTHYSVWHVEWKYFDGLGARFRAGAIYRVDHFVFEGDGFGANHAAAASALAKILR